MHSRGEQTHSLVCARYSPSVQAARVLGNLHRLEGAYRTIQNRILILDTEISSKTAMIERDCDSVRGQLGKAELASLGQLLLAVNDVVQRLTALSLSDCALTVL